MTAKSESNSWSIWWKISTAAYEERRIREDNEKVEMESHKVKVLEGLQGLITQ